MNTLMRERRSAKRAWSLVARVSVLSLAPSPCAFADLASCPANRDNTLYESDVGTVSNGAGQHLFAGVTLEGRRRRALLSFDLSSIPPGSTITSASPAVSVSLANGVISGELHRLLAPWSEGVSDAGEPGGQGATAAVGDATWLHTSWPDAFWTAPGGDFVASPSSTVPLGPPGSVVWPSSSSTVSDVQSWLDNPATNFGWIVVATGGAARLSSRENANPASRPVLIVEYTPPCPADFNLSGAVSVQDIFDFLTAYFGGDLAADFNRSGGVSVQDIFDFLTSYFTPCV